MVFGYTPFDPLVVLLGTAMAIHFLATDPIRLMRWMPTMLTIYFFIPTITLLTLWQAVPLLLAGRLFLRMRLYMASFARPVLAIMALAFVASATYALVEGGDLTRAVVRILYYLGLFALIVFAYEMGRKPQCLNILMRGLVVLGTVLAVYGLYQFVAVQTGLPVRGILRGTHGVDVPFEGAIPRINSLANEPKRLGYVMFICGMAALFLARTSPAHGFRLTIFGYSIFGLSVLTFAGSYFLTIALFAVIVVFLYPSRATIWILAAVSTVSFTFLFFPDLGIFETIAYGFERRLDEVEVGLDGRVVYRQEFYAWDYLKENPVAMILGVSLGQYFEVLNQQYGTGVGYNIRGGLVPLNSNFLELVFDLSGIAAVIFYGAMAILILRLRRVGETFLCLALLFVTLQSFSILTAQWMTLFAGVGVARLAVTPADHPRATGA